MQRHLFCRCASRKAGLRSGPAAARLGIFLQLTRHLRARMTLSRALEVQEQRFAQLLAPSCWPDGGSWLLALGSWPKREQQKTEERPRRPAPRRAGAGGVFDQLAKPGNRKGKRGRPESLSACHITRRVVDRRELSYHGVWTAGGQGGNIRLKSRENPSWPRVSDKKGNPVTLYSLHGGGVTGLSKKT